jgi:hypothetical protein
MDPVPKKAGGCLAGGEPRFVPAGITSWKVNPWYGEVPYFLIVSVDVRWAV